MILLEPKMKECIPAPLDIWGRTEVKTNDLMIRSILSKCEKISAIKPLVVEDYAEGDEETCNCFTTELGEYKLLQELEKKGFTFTFFHSDNFHVKTVSKNGYTLPLAVPENFSPNVLQYFRKALTQKLLNMPIDLIKASPLMRFSKVPYVGDFIGYDIIKSYPSVLANLPIPVLKGGYPEKFYEVRLKRDKGLNVFYFGDIITIPAKYLNLLDSLTGYEIKREFTIGLGYTDLSYYIRSAFNKVDMSQFKLTFNALIGNLKTVYYYHWRNEILFNYIIMVNNLKIFWLLSQIASADRFLSLSVDGIKLRGSQPITAEHIGDYQGEFKRFSGICFAKNYRGYYKYNGKLKINNENRLAEDIVIEDGRPYLIIGGKKINYGKV